MEKVIKSDHYTFNGKEVELLLTQIDPRLFRVKLREVESERVYVNVLTGIKSGLKHQSTEQDIETVSNQAKEKAIVCYEQAKLICCPDDIDPLKKNIRAAVLREDHILFGKKATLTLYNILRGEVGGNYLTMIEMDDGTIFDFQFTELVDDDYWFVGALTSFVSMRKTYFKNDESPITIHIDLTTVVKEEHFTVEGKYQKLLLHKRLDDRYVLSRVSYGEDASGAAVVQGYGGDKLFLYRSEGNPSEEDMLKHYEESRIKYQTEFGAEPIKSFECPETTVVVQQKCIIDGKEAYLSLIRCNKADPLMQYRVLLMKGSEVLAERSKVSALGPALLAYGGMWRKYICDDEELKNVSVPPTVIIRSPMKKMNLE